MPLGAEQKNEKAICLYGLDLDWISDVRRKFMGLALTSVGSICCKVIGITFRLKCLLIKE